MGTKVMKNLRLILVALGILAGGAVTLVIAAPWTDTQTASGSVTAQSTSELLYICDADVGVFGPDPLPQCSGVGDDSGPDEIIFEGDEALTPGGAPASLDIFLINVSTGAWDVTGVTTTITETLDPGADCFDEPVVSISYVFAVFGVSHDPGTEPIPESQVFDGPFGPKVLHTDPVGNVSMRIEVRLPASVQAECIGSAWDIVTEWTVQPHD